MYQDTQYIAECALENLHMLTQTTEGEKAINDYGFIRLMISETALCFLYVWLRD